MKMTEAETKEWAKIYNEERRRQNPNALYRSYARLALWKMKQAAK